MCTDCYCIIYSTIFISVSFKPTIVDFAFVLDMLALVVGNMAMFEFLLYSSYSCRLLYKSYQRDKRNLANILNT